MVKFKQSGTRRARSLLSTAANLVASGISLAKARRGKTRGLTFTKTAHKMRRYAKSKVTNTMKRKAPYSNLGGQGTFSMFKLRSKPNPKIRAMKKVGAPCYDLFNQSQQIIAPEGFQNFGTYVFDGINDLRRMLSHVSINPGGVTKANNTRQYVLESTTGEFLITNSSLATAYVDVYDIVRKRDANVSVATQSPNGAWTQGTADQNAATTISDQIGCLPTDALLFRDWFKVKRRTHIALAQGATHRHMVKLNPNKLIDAELVGANVAGDLAGIGCYTMIVCYGQPASEPEGTLVTTAKVALDIVYSVRSKFTFVDNYISPYYVVDNLPSLTSENIISAGAGQVVLNAIA